MRVEEIRQIARAKGVVPGHLKKSELIHCVQLREGNFDCSGTAVEGICSQWDCLWSADCMSYGLKGLRR